MAFSANSFDPVEIALKNIGALAPLAVVFLGWLAATLKKAKNQAPGAPGPGQSAGDEAERTRKVQEDVRRKIAERRRGGIPPLDPYGGPGGRLRRILDIPDVVSARPAPIPPTRDEQAALARQEQMATQMRELAAAPQKSFVASSPSAAGAPAGSISPWLSELREPAGVRRAIVLREILGTPVGLRQ